MSLFFNMLSRLVTAFLPRNKCLLISWLQSPCAVILEPPKIKYHITMKRQRDMTVKLSDLKQSLFYLPMILFCGLGSTGLASTHSWDSTQRAGQLGPGLSWNPGTWALWSVWSQAPPIPWEPPLYLSMCSWQWCDWSPCIGTQGSQEHKSSSFQTLIMVYILSTPKIYSPSTLLEPRVRPILTLCLDWKSRVLSSKSDPGVEGFSLVTSSGKSVWRRQWHPTPVLLPGKIPWMGEPGRLQSMGSLRVGHDRTTSLSLFTFMRWRGKWKPTPLFLSGESQGWGSLVGCCL